MCLAIPAKLVQCQGTEGVADLHGNRVQVNTTLTPEARVGDWVLVHAGFVIQRLDEDQAAATWSVLEDLQDRIEESDHESTPV